MQQWMSRLLRDLLATVLAFPVVVFGQTPDNLPGLIAFTSTQDGHSSIYMMRANGSIPRRVTDGADPSFSPDGSKIVFVRGGDIYLANQNGANITQLTHHGLGIIASSPVFNTKGDCIAFVTGPDVPNPLTSVRMINSDGSDECTLATMGSDPVFSPDGLNLVFARNDSLYTMSIKAMNRQQYIPYLLYNFGPGTIVRYPSFTTFSNGVAYSLCPTNGTPVWSIVMLMSSQNRTRSVMTNNAFQPAFSPDGHYFAFSRDGDIYIMSINGGTPIRLTSSIADETDPAWWAPR
ncbi:MAG TPA: DPP IV N-terminal domain-containing protein [Armatimonadota bacterium]|nr:DPP IV N-terminal domain-containing protein [Armatimonadota bacterium]